MDRKIIVNGSIIHEKPTGLGVYAINVARELSREENVEVYSPVEIEGVKVKGINKYVKPSYKKLGGLLRFLWTQLILPFKGKRGDIIYHPFQYVSLLSRKKQIMTIHDFIPVHYPTVAKHQNIYYKYIMPVLLKKAYKIVCISENTKRDLESLYHIDGDKIKVIYNGYDKKLFNNKDITKSALRDYSLKNPYLIMVGAGYSHKNLEIVIKAFGEIRDKNLDLVIVGGNSPYILSLKELVKDMDVKDRIKFIGYVKDDDLKNLYANAKAFVYPTLYEGFGLPILEAQACGTAVICADNSSLPEVYGNSVISFDAKSVEEVKASIEKLLTEKGLREDLIKKGYENIKRFSWEKTSKEIIKIID